MTAVALNSDNQINGLKCGAPLLTGRKNVLGACVFDAFGSNRYRRLIHCWRLSDFQHSYIVKRENALLAGLIYVELLYMFLELSELDE